MRIFLLALVFLIGCGTSVENNSGDDVSNKQISHQGYVAEIEDGRVLVVDKLLEKPYEEYDLEKFLGLVKTAIWFNVENINQKFIQSLIVGEKVGASTNMVMDSFPQQATATSMERIVDEKQDLISLPGKFSNIHVYKLFSQKIMNKEPARFRSTIYTTEGDPIFRTIQYESGSFTIYTDSTRDKFGEKTVRNITCGDLFKNIDGTNVEVKITECDNEGEIPLLMMDVNKFLIPEQTYTKLIIKIDGEIQMESTDNVTIKDTIEKIRKANKESLAARTMLAPDGKLILQGDKTDISFSYYKSGILTGEGLYIPAELKFGN